ncbi:MAG: OmpA family protein [Myxococcales bacterium]|nr:OmpA family protein [Myxococcales bacterium]
MMVQAWVMGVAWAQSDEAAGFDAHGFHLAAHDADLRDPLTVRRPGPFHAGDWFVGALAEYAKAPLVEVITDADGAQTTRNVVDNLMVANLSVGVAAHERLRLDVAAPVVAFSTGAEASAGGPALGDMRLSALVVPVRPRHVTGGGGFGLGVVGHVDLPTGAPARFLGRGAVAGGGALTATYEARRVTVSGELGAQVDGGGTTQNLGGRSAVLAGLGLGWAPSDTVGLTLEATSTMPWAASPLAGAQTLPPSELLASARIKAANGPFWTLGAAAGLTDGPGVAAFRAFVGMGFARQRTALPPDTDPVGALMATDLCPTEPETVNGWKDDDGCPDRLGTLAVDVQFAGESRAANAVILGPQGKRSQRIGPQGLAIDAVPGTQWTIQASEGCLAGEASATAAEGGAQLLVELRPIYDARVAIEVYGTDGGPLPGAQVVWTSERAECVPQGPNTVDELGALSQSITSGTHTLVVTAPQHNVHEQVVELLAGDERAIRVDLAASRIVVEKKQIRILDKVEFETAKAVIQPSSYSLLDEVAATIITNPDLGRVEISGHTDSRGSPVYNQQLSESRAKAVMDYLVGKGVAAARLLAVGYGEERPIETNKTPGGREKNRRVEFTLLDAEEDRESRPGR